MESFSFVLISYMWQYIRLHNFLHFVLICKLCRVTPVTRGTHYNNLNLSAPMYQNETDASA